MCPPPKPTPSTAPVPKEGEKKPEDATKKDDQKPEVKQGDAKPEAGAQDPKKPAGGTSPDPKKPGDLGKNPSTTALGNGPAAKINLISIENYDSAKFHIINSPRSLQAMETLGIEQKDLKLNTAEDLQGMFNLNDEEEKKAFAKCVEKHKQANTHLVNKIKAKRTEMIEQQAEKDKRRKEQEDEKLKQLKRLEEEKKAILKKLEAEKAEQKKREEAAKKKKDEKEKAEKKGDVKKPDAGKKEAPKSAETGKKEAPKSAETGKKPDNNLPSSPDQKKVDPKANPKVDPKAPAAAPNQGQPGAGTSPVNPQGQPVGMLTSVDLTKSQESLKNKKSPLSARGGLPGEKEEDNKPLKLEDELKESSILVFLDKSTTQKHRLDLGLKEKTKKELERDKQRMKELMKQQKDQLIEMSQKRAASAYKSQEGLGNAKTRHIEYLNDLSRNPVEMMKDKQQKEMEHMMNYEIALQVSSRLI